MGFNIKINGLFTSLQIDGACLGTDLLQVLKMIYIYKVSAFIIFHFFRVSEFGW